MGEKKKKREDESHSAMDHQRPARVHINCNSSELPDFCFPPTYFEFKKHPKKR